MIALLGSQTLFGPSVSGLLHGPRWDRYLGSLRLPAATSAGEFSPQSSGRRRIMSENSNRKRSVSPVRTGKERTCPCLDLPFL